ncbi:peptidase domain-containing ABC transporter [Lacibacterium aquatile]|uniref:Peptidase domain-containing ABC transporter n=1 Tax=Lacibacterium aquatile TaxID=1168082 RepID=A0ABW5DW28_9PROT
MGDTSWRQSLLASARGAWRELLLASLFINILALALPVFTLQIYDRVIGLAGLTTLIGLVLGMGVVTLFDWALRTFRSRLVQRISLEIDVTVARGLFDQVSALPLRILESRPGAYWQGLFRDVETIRNAASGPPITLMADLPFALLYVGLIWIVATPVAWVITLAVFAYAIFAWISAARLQSAAQAERTAGLSRDALVGEFVAGRSTLKALAMDRSFKPQWEEAQANLVEKALGRGAGTDGSGNLALAMTTITTVAMTAFGALAVLDQKMSIGALIAANMLAGRVNGPLMQLFPAWKSVAAARASLKRLDEVFQVEPERITSPVQFPRPSGLLQAENLTFRYIPDGQPTVDTVNITMKPGSMLGLAGRNGSGKSTLLKLLMGLYKPDVGRVMLDGADVSQFSRADLADWVGYAPQDPMLFTGTIRDNLLRAAPDIDDEALILACTRAGLHSFVIDLPDGYSTQIGEAGGRLAGGLRQRLSLARALLRDPPVLLLDEPSNNLDPMGEETLRRTLIELASGGRTIVLVSHSVQLLTACSVIALMDHGKVVQAGPPNDILPKLLGRRPQPVPQQQPAAAPTAAGRPA